MQLAGTAPERRGGVQVRADRIADPRRDLRRRQLGKTPRRVVRWNLAPLNVIVEAAELVGRVRPTICLTLDQPLHHRRRGHRLGRSLVVEGSGHGGDAAPANLLGAVTADLEVGIDAGLEAAKQLQDLPVAVDDRGVALFCAGPRYAL